MRSRSLIRLLPFADYLLEDLQQSVSRPGSSLGHNSASNFSTLSSNRDRDVQYFTSPNSTSKVIRERSVSPTSGRRTFKTSKYEYSTSSSGGGNVGSLPRTDSGYNTSSKVNVETSLNQLDSLLNELKVERDLASEPSTFVFVEQYFSTSHDNIYGYSSSMTLSDQTATGLCVPPRKTLSDEDDIFIPRSHMTHIYRAIFKLFIGLAY